MNLPDDKIKEFQGLYKKHFGKTISYERAEIEGLRLIGLISIIQPKKNGYENEPRTSSSIQ
jgi:hypothetical protein